MVVVFVKFVYVVFACWAVLGLRSSGTHLAAELGLCAAVPRPGDVDFVCWALFGLRSSGSRFGLLDSGCAWQFLGLWHVVEVQSLVVPHSATEMLSEYVDSDMPFFGRQQSSPGAGRPWSEAKSLLCFTFAAKR